VSVSVRPLEQIEFRGVFTAGNPIQRPRNSAQVCEDFRVMPGNYLRLRSGRAAQYKFAAGDTVINIAPFRQQGQFGSDQQLAQVVGSGAAKWHWFTVLNYLIQNGITDIEPIQTAYDNGYALNNPVAACNLSDRPVIYNGYGVRSGGASRPPFSTHTTGGTRFFGLDSYVPSGIPPSVSHSPGTGGANKALTGLRLYVGLWHAPSDHYSNGVFMGQFGPLAPGTITASNLNQLSYASHGSSETSELYYVFYATIDGGSIPYLILNAALNGPYAVPVTTSTADLSIAPTTVNGWVLDFTKEAPTENFPPRPMRSIATVNARLYGVLMVGAIGDAGGRDFTYLPTPRDMSAVVWSAAAGDAVEADFLGDPLQSWPLWNLQYTPSGDQPLIVTASPDETRVLVVTPTSTFFLEEQADGIHEWDTISRVHGIGKPQTLRVTRYGIVWVDQRNQIVLLRPGSNQIEVLSGSYQGLLTGSVRCADYILDPEALIDRYQVWLSTAKSVCHDFLLESPGVAYTATNQDYLAAASAVDIAGRKHHIVAKDAFYTHEVQPFAGGIAVTDATFQANGSVAYSEITGQYVRNWDDFGDGDVRKEMPMVDLIGDGAPAASLGGASPLTLEWYADFEQVTGANKKTVIGAPISQSLTSPTFRFKLKDAMRFWYKLVFRLVGHSTEYGGVNGSYPDPAVEGDLARNFSASVLRALWRLGASENRP
jgi:hypothetical protein